MKIIIITYGIRKAPDKDITKSVRHQKNTFSTEALAFPNGLNNTTATTETLRTRKKHHR